MSSPPPSLGVRSLLGLALLTLLVRGGVFAHRAWTDPGFLDLDRARIEERLGNDEEPFVHRFGFEASNVAWALACDHQGLASPFGGRTGPTGWVSPGLVAIWASAFLLFGCFTTTAVGALFAVAALASVGTVLLGIRAGLELYGTRRGGILAGFLLVLSPWDLALFHARSLLDPNLSVLAGMVLLALLLMLLRCGRTGTFLGFAVAAALATLVNPVLALPAAAGLVLVLLLRRDGVPFVRTLAIHLGVQILVLGPYALYQHRAVGTWSPVKTNFPFEVYLGNLPEADGFLETGLLARRHPSLSSREYREYVRLGETAYVRSRFARFLDRVEPQRFAAAVARRGAELFLLHRDRPWQDFHSRWIHRLLGLAPGTILLIYLLVVGRVKGFHGGDAVVYLFVAGCSVPYLLTGIVERYELIVIPPVLVLLAGVVDASLGFLHGRPTRGERVSSGLGFGGENEVESGQGG